MGLLCGGKNSEWIIILILLFLVFYGFGSQKPAPCGC